MRNERMISSVTIRGLKPSLSSMQKYNIYPSGVVRKAVEHLLRELGYTETPVHIRRQQSLLASVANAVPAKLAERNFHLVPQAVLPLLEPIAPDETVVEICLTTAAFGTYERDRNGVVYPFVDTRWHQGERIPDATVIIDDASRPLILCSAFEARDKRLPANRILAGLAARALAQLLVPPVVEHGHDASCIVVNDARTAPALLVLAKRVQAAGPYVCDACRG